MSMSMETPAKTKTTAEHSSFLESQHPHLRDIRLAIEFKHLISHAPGGVYLFPHNTDIRQLFGVIFVRKGLYSDGIFRFKITLPPEYNSPGTCPAVVFTPPIFHPLVDPKTGAVRLESSAQFGKPSEWDNKKHFLITILIFLKKIFYIKSYEEYENVPNEEALKLYESSQEEYMKYVQDCVKDAAENLNRMPAECPLVFTESKPAHQTLREQIFGASAAEREARRRAVSLAPHIGFLSPETPATHRVEDGSRRVGGITVKDRAEQRTEMEKGQNLTSDFTDEPIQS